MDVYLSGCATITEKTWGISVIGPPLVRESLCIGNYGGDYGDYYGTTAASTASFRRQISKSGIRRWLLDVLLLVHSRKPARHLKTGPRSQKVGLVSITKVFFGGFYVLK